MIERVRDNDSWVIPSKNGDNCDIRWSDDGSKLLLYGSRSGSLEVWDIASRKLIRSCVPPPHAGVPVTIPWVDFQGDADVISMLSYPPSGVQTTCIAQWNLTSNEMIDLKGDGWKVLDAEHCSRLLLQTEYGGNPNEFEFSLWDTRAQRPLAQFSAAEATVLDASRDYLTARIADSGDRIFCATQYDNNVHTWHRRRPEYWWGIAWLPEFWLMVLFAVALVWSVWRDRKTTGNAIH